MKKQLLSSVLSFTLVTGAAMPALADWDRGWHGGYHDRGYRDHDDDGYRGHGYGYGRRWYHRHPVYLERNYYYGSRPVYAPEFVPPGHVTTVSCEAEYNPLPFVVGSVAGGALGSTVGRHNGRTAAIIGGALIGGLLGNQYTTYDRRCTRQVFESVPVGQSAYWSNAAAHSDYTVTPVRDYQAAGRYCREYQAVATVGGHRQETYGQACMQPDGSWEIVN